MFKTDQEPLLLSGQGSFTVGGTVQCAPGCFDPDNPSEAGQTRSGDHAYVFWQMPLQPRKMPLIFIHGNGQSKKTWETTADGREGFQNIFLRRNFGVFLVDQPRRGEAGRAAVPYTVPVPFDDQLATFEYLRIGHWPDYFEGGQFPTDPESLNQQFRSATPNTAPFDLDVTADAYSALLEKTGEAILVSHSRGGGVGWFTAMRNRNVKAIVSFEPGSNFPFPKGEAPDPMISTQGALTPMEVEKDDFMKLAEIPIIMYYGDNIPEKPVPNPGQDMWRTRRAMAGKFAEKLREYGGDVTLTDLPKIGIRGNSHLIFADRNNLEIADLMSDFLREKKLDLF